MTHTDIQDTIATIVKDARVTPMGARVTQHGLYVMGTMITPTRAGYSCRTSRAETFTDNMVVRGMLLSLMTDKVALKGVIVGKFIDVLKTHGCAPTSQESLTYKSATYIAQQDERTVLKIGTDTWRVNHKTLNVTRRVGNRWIIQSPIDGFDVATPMDELKGLVIQCGMMAV